MTFVISYGPIAFSQNLITYYNNFVAVNNFRLSLSYFSVFYSTLPSKAQKTPQCSLAPVSPCSLRAHLLHTFPRLSISAESNPAICTCCRDQQQDSHKGNVNSEKTPGLCGFLFSGKSIRQQMTPRIHCNKPSTAEVPLIYHNDDSNWIGRLIAFSQAVEIQ